MMNIKFATWRDREPAFLILPRAPKDRSGVKQPLRYDVRFHIISHSFLRLLLTAVSTNSRMLLAAVLSTQKIRE